MKKIVFMLMFIANFVIVNAVLNLDFANDLSKSFLEKDLTLWLGILSLGVFGLFTLELVKDINKELEEKVEESKGINIDFYA